MNYLFIYQIYFNECTTLTNRRILHLLEQDFYLQHTQYDKVRLNDFHPTHIKL